MSLRPGSYIIRPVVVPDENLIIGPVPRIFPPPDVPVRVGSPPDRWQLKPEEGNTYTVFTGTGNPNDYKWIVREENFLFVTSTGPPQHFRFEPAGDSLWRIGLPNQDLVLTFLSKEALPPLVFQPANGSPAQHFEVIPIERE